MTNNAQFQFMTDPPSLERLLSGNDYRAIQDAATRLKERMNAGEKASDSVLTASRTLLETVCKTFLVLLDVEYEERDSLSALGRLLLRALDLHPSKRTVNALNQTYQGALSMLEGISCLRNAHSDSHGKSVEHSDRLPTHHAELAAYLSCALTRCLIFSFEDRVRRKARTDLSGKEKSSLVDVWLELGGKHGITNPDKLPYSSCLEEIGQVFTRKTSIILPRRDIYLLLQDLRKAKRPPSRSKKQIR